MAELLFRRGTQSALNTIKDNKTAQDGTFYLTTDTGRIYAGIGSELVELNKSITTVSSVSNLPATGVEKGQFYYVEGNADGKAENTHGGNILAVYNGDSWVQINPDTDHYLLNSTSATSVTATTGVTNSATVTTTVQDTLNGRNGLNTARGAFSIEGNDNISVTVDGTKIKLAVADGALYKLNTATKTVGGSAGVSVNLVENPDATGAGTDAGNFTILSGDFTSVTRDASGNIKVEAKDPGIKDFSITANTGTTAGVKFEIKDANDTPHYKTLNVPVKLDGVSGEETVNIINGTYDLPVYTAGQTDAKIEAAILESHRSLDALRYQGLIADVATLNGIVNATKLSVSNGDVYKVSEDIDSGISTKFKTPAGAAITKLNKGDLIIFKGAENADGFLNAPTAEVVPSGDDQLIQGSVDATNNTMTVVDSMDPANKTGIKVIAGTSINVSSKKTNDILNTTITHADVTKDTAPNTTKVNVGLTSSGITDSETFTIVETVEANEQGHVTKITTREVTIADTHTDIKTVQNTIANVKDNNAAVTVTTGVSTVDAPTAFHNGSYTISGIGNVVARADGNSNVKLSLEWGTF